MFKAEPCNHYPVEVNGKLYHLKYDFRAAIEFEEKTGESLLEFGRLLEQHQRAILVENLAAAKEKRQAEMPPVKISAKSSLALLWCGLVHEKDAPTFEQLSNSIPFNQVANLANQCYLAVLDLVNVEDDGKKKAETANPSKSDG